MSDSTQKQTIEKKPAKKVRPPRQPMPHQDPELRRKNFDEVTFGYAEGAAVLEASRCTYIPRSPCKPVHLRSSDVQNSAKNRDTKSQISHYLYHTRDIHVKKNLQKFLCRNYVGCTLRLEVYLGTAWGVWVSIP